MQSLYFDVTVPPGVEIRDSPTFGRGLYATKHFKRGEILFTFPTVFIPNQPGTITVTTQHHQVIDIDVMDACLKVISFLVHTLDIVTPFLSYFHECFTIQISFYLPINNVWESFIFHVCFYRQTRVEKKI